MRNLRVVGIFSFAVVSMISGAGVNANETPDKAIKHLKPSDFQMWKLPPKPPYPEHNKPTPARIELGKKLFFDPRVSRDGNMSCASCHNPMFGWSDGLATGRGFAGQLLGRASPTIVNAGYNTIQMWDGRKKDLEDQAMGPLEAAPEMNTDLERFFAWMNTNAGYKADFAKAYPGEPIAAATFQKAIASFERTVVSRNSPFDKWVAGETKAMSKQQLRGMYIFMNPKMGNCAVCHSAPNFTDNGFHNLGLSSYGKENADLGRYAIKRVAINKGAFKTPTLRDVEYTAPFFHDGSAQTLMDVVEHYNKGGEVHSNLSPNVRPLNLSQQDKEDLVSFMKALSSPRTAFALPALPHD